MHTMNLDQLRATASAGAVSGITLTAQGAAFIVNIETLRGGVPAVMVTSKGRAGEAPTPRKFLDPRKAMLLLRDLGINELRIDGAKWRPDDRSASTPRPDRSAAMKATHAAKAHADWLNRKVQASLADPVPNVAHAQAMLDAQALIDSKRRQHARRIRKTARA
jgi:hypothetical protein